MLLSNDIVIRAFEIDDYGGAVALWETTENLCLGEASSREMIDQFLKRNPFVSSVAESNGRIIGTIIAGHDGYRGHIKYLAVDKDFRNQQIAKRLVNRSLDKLKDDNVKLIYLSVKDENLSIKGFWNKFGLKEYGEMYPNVSSMCGKL